MNELPYPSDLTASQWALIEPLLPGPKPKGRKRRVDLRLRFGLRPGPMKRARNGSQRSVFERLSLTPFDHVDRFRYQLSLVIFRDSIRAFAGFWCKLEKLALWR